MWLTECWGGAGAGEENNDALGETDLPGTEGAARVWEPGEDPAQEACGGASARLWLLNLDWKAVLCGERSVQLPIWDGEGAEDAGLARPMGRSSAL